MRVLTQGVVFTGSSDDRLVAEEKLAEVKLDCAVPGVGLQAQSQEGSGLR